MNEPIIIDDVDVAGCEFFRAVGADLYCECENNKPNYIGNTTFSCKFNPNCYYKQLQRLKADRDNVLNDYIRIKRENIKLQEDLTALQQTNEACEKEYRALNKRYEQLHKAFHEQSNLIRNLYDISKVNKYKEITNIIRNYHNEKDVQNAD